MNTLNTQTYKHLLASTLREKHDSYIIEELLNHYPHPSHLIDATERELIKSIKGIGVSKSKQIIAAVQHTAEVTKKTFH